MGGGGGQDVSYTQSPQQRQMQNLLMPVIKSFYGYGQQGPGTFDASAQPVQAPVDQSVWNWKQKARAQGINPNASSGGQALGMPGQALMPMAGWFEGMDESIKTGLREPYLDMGQKLMEQMNMRGQLGGGAGMSPAAGAFMGEFGAEAGKGMGMQAWNMTQPGRMLPYQMLPGLLGQSQATPVVGAPQPGMLDYMSGLGTLALGIGSFF
jgi:hypothetical protein